MSVDAPAGDLVTPALDGRVALEVVDLDHAGAVAWPFSMARPSVVIGVSESGRSAHDLSPETAESLDIVLVPEGSGAGAAARPGVAVAVADVRQELERLRAVVDGSPLASVVLLQVLRSSAPSLAHDLVLESLAYSLLQAGPEHRRWLEARSARPAGRAEPEAAVVVEREGERLTITLNRPHVRNAYNVAIRDGLYEAFELVRLDPTIRAVRLRGEGPSFSSGGDLDEFGTGPGPVAAHLIRTTASPALGLAAAAARVTAELQGACVGAGIELPALAGRVVAAGDLRVRLPEVAMGLIPGAGGTASIPRRIGRHRTAWLALGGGWLDGPTALAWGLVDELV